MVRRPADGGVARRRSTGQVRILAVLTCAAVSLVTSVEPAESQTGSAARAPIEIMTLGDFAASPQWPGALKARISVVNARGGIRDATGERHEVEVVECDTSFDTAAADACATRAVSEGVTAVVGMSVARGDEVWRRLEAAKIPVIGPRVNGPVDATSTVSFPVGAGIVGIFTAMPQLLARRGATTIGVVMSDFGDATPTTLAQLDAGLARSGAGGGPVVVVPLGVTNVEPYVRAAMSASADGLVVIVEPSIQVAVLEGLHAAAYAGLSVVPLSAADRLISALAAEADGTLVVSEFEPLIPRRSAPGLQRFRRDMLKHAPDLELDEGAINFWLAGWVFERVASGLRRIDAQTILGAMEAVEALDMGGVTPPLTTSGTTVELPRLFNPTVKLARIRHGFVTPLSKQFFDPLSGTNR